MIGFQTHTITIPGDGESVVISAAGRLLVVFSAPDYDALNAPLIRLGGSLSGGVPAIKNADISTPVFFNTVEVIGRGASGVIQLLTHDDPCAGVFSPKGAPQGAGAPDTIYMLDSNRTIRTAGFDLNNTPWEASDPIATIGAGTPLQLLGDTAAGYLFAARQNGTSYFIDRYGLDGTFIDNIVTFASGAMRGVSISPDNGWIVVLDDPGLLTMRCYQYDGSVVKSFLITNNTIAGMMDVEGDNAYWLGSSQDDLIRTDLVNETSEKVDDIVEGNYDVPNAAVDEGGGFFFWIDRGSEALRKIALDASGEQETILPNFSASDSALFAYREEKLLLYGDDQQVKSCDYDGGNITTLCSTAALGDIIAITLGI